MKHFIDKKIFDTKSDEAKCIYTYSYDTLHGQYKATTSSTTLYSYKDIFVLERCSPSNTIPNKVEKLTKEEAIEWLYKRGDVKGAIEALELLGVKLEEL